MTETPEHVSIRKDQNNARRNVLPRRILLRTFLIVSIVLAVLVFAETIVTAHQTTLSGRLVSILLVSCLISLLLTVMITRSIVHPLAAITKYIQSADTTSPRENRRDWWDRNDEIDDLHKALHNQTALAHRAHLDDKLRLIGGMTNSIAHDFNNVLAIIIGHSELMADDDDNLDAHSKEALVAISNAAYAGAAISRRLQFLSGQRVETQMPLDVDDILENLSSVADLVIKKPNSGIEITFDCQTTDAVLIDQCALEAALLNLILNARDAVFGIENGLITVEACSSHRGGLPAVEFAVRDNGIGIEPQNLDHVRAPFFTTKCDAGNSGVGLAMVDAFVTNCGGRMRIESQVNQGTTVTLTLPSASAR